jgi:hypothetical protein
MARRSASLGARGHLTGDRGRRELSEDRVSLGRFGWQELEATGARIVLDDAAAPEEAEDASTDRGEHVGDVGRGEGRELHETRRSLRRLGILGVDAVEEQDMQMWVEPEV